MSIFEKIIHREIPAQIVLEDEMCLAFKDINPQAPVHLLLIPKKPIATLDDLTNADQELMGHLMIQVPALAQNAGLKNGYRLVINCKEYGGQEVNHLHMHILGGRQMKWPPG